MNQRSPSEPPPAAGILKKGHHPDPTATRPGGNISFRPEICGEVHPRPRQTVVGADSSDS